MLLLIYFIIIIVIVVQISKKKASVPITPQQKGNQGENEIKSILYNFNAYNKQLYNVYLETKYGKTTEVDIIVVSTKGIYVIENKNYKGWIFGDEEQTKWCQTFKSGKNFFYNPILQNKLHINAINEILKLAPDKYESIIIFDRAEIKKMNVTSNKTYVTTKQKFDFYIKNQNMLKDIMSKEQVDNIYNILQNTARTTDEIKLRHIMGNQNIK